MDTSFERNSNSIEWYTPPAIVQSLGRFDLDPCAPTPIKNDTLDGYFWPQPGQPFASGWYCKEDDGLSKEWTGRCWVNPPYGRETGAWLKKLAQHSDGVALVFARTETQSFFDHVWGKASGILFLKGRVKFLKFIEGQGCVEGKNSAGAPSVLISYDTDGSWRNAQSLKDSGIPGHFVDLTPTEVVWSGWKLAIRSILEFGPLSLKEIYEWVGRCIHRPQNNHIEAKIRQTLNRYEDLFEQTEGIWRLKEYV